jgi:Zn-dependent metalloprotease
MSDSVIPFMSQLQGEDQSAALVVSFGNIMSCLVEQWQQKQRPDEASWLVGANMFQPRFKGRALFDLAHPGAAYNDPKLGKDPQPGHMKDYVQTGSDYGGAHTNSGIPNRAFVLVAKAIGGYAWEKPGRIWFESYRMLKRNSSLTLRTQHSMLPKRPTAASRAPRVKR